MITAINSSINFQSNMSLPKASTTKMQGMLKRMNKETVAEDKYSAFIKALLTKRGELTDNRLLLKPIEDVGQGHAIITLPTFPPTVLAVDVENGKILQLKKPFYISLNNIFVRVGKFLDDLSSNYDKSLKKITSIPHSK